MNETRFIQRHPVALRVSAARLSAVLMIPAGPFTMGATAEDLKLARAMCADELRDGGALMLEVSPRCGTRFDSESPALKVTMPAFAIDKTEVTVGDYLQCVRNGPCTPIEGMHPAQDPRLPVERVSWDQAHAFCVARGGRLPTEAQWEKAARSITHRTFPWGQIMFPARANHGRALLLGPSGEKNEDADLTLEQQDASDGFATRAPVGSFPRGGSPYGVLDLAGNVAEWTDDYFQREPPQTIARYAPRGPAYGTERTVRGGGYLSPPSELRVTRRWGLDPKTAIPGLGFRCAYSLTPARVSD